MTSSESNFAADGQQSTPKMGSEQKIYWFKSCIFQLEMKNKFPLCKSRTLKLSNVWFDIGMEDQYGTWKVF